MLDHIRVEAYDEKMPLHTLATVLARDAQLLVASVYDPAVRRVLHVGVAPCRSWIPLVSAQLQKIHQCSVLRFVLHAHLLLHALLC